jgi:hypothetical protein
MFSDYIIDQHNRDDSPQSYWKTGIAIKTRHDFILIQIIPIGMEFWVYLKDGTS